MSAKDHQPATGATPLEPPEAATTLVVDALGTPDHGSQAPSPAPSSPEAMERKGALNCFFDGLGLILSRPRILVALTLASLVAALPVAFTVHDSAQEHFAHLVPHAEDAPLDFVKTAP
ncbi:MAG: hypothetical protein MK213_10425, partial [Planctomycetes bacterium]|nr:hypothetical protein [Planctomycetota bacterium]